MPCANEHPASIEDPARRPTRGDGRRLPRGAVVALALLLATGSARAADRPEGVAFPDAEFVEVPAIEGIPGPLFLEMPTLTFVPKGTMRVTLGARWQDDVELPYSGLAGDLAQLGMVRVDVGFGSRIAVRIQGTTRQVLKIDWDQSRQVPPSNVDPADDRTDDAGDFSVLTVAQIMPQRGWKPALGLRVEAKLPNTSQANGIGTNTTDVLLSVPAQSRFGRLVVNTDVGLAILTHPTNAQAQTDSLLYGLSAAYELTPRWLVSGELVGRWAHNGGTIGTGNRGGVHVGVSWSKGPLAVGLIASHGYGEGGERIGGLLSVSYGFRVFESVRRD